MALAALEPLLAAPVAALEPALPAAAVPLTPATAVVAAAGVEETGTPTTCSTDCSRLLNRPCVDVAPCAGLLPDVLCAPFL